MLRILGVIILMFCFGSARADSYYCMIFAQDSKPISIPFLCHIWGNFVQVSDKGKLIKELNISWEPDKITCTDRPVPGHHSSLHGCLQFANKRRCVLRMWGPYEVDKELFDRAEVVFNAPGKYKFFDVFTRCRDAKNCIHTLSDLSGKKITTGVRWGHWAAECVAKRLRKDGMLKRTDNGDQVINLLEIDRYVIERKYLK